MLLRSFADAFCGTGSNEATLLMSFIYSQSGYKIRLGQHNGKLEMLYASLHKVYGVPYFECDGDKFYAMSKVSGSIKINERTFFRITIPCHEAAGNIIADIAHKDGTLKASKRGSLKTALQSAPETALQIINEIRNNPNETLSEIAEILGVSRRWIATVMKQLQDTGVVKRVGPNKGGHWEIIA